MINSAPCFIIVGKKDEDCYVLYDRRANMGGRACATLYTINQLVAGGYGVLGVNNVVGQKIKAKDIRIMNTDGTIANRVSTHSDVCDIKRSASTFIKGIKRSKEEVQKAKVVGEKRSQTIQTKKESIDPRKTDVIDFYKDILTNGVEIKRMTPQKISSIYNFGLEKSQRVYDFEQLFDKNGTPMPAYFSRSKEVFVSKKKMLERYANIVTKIGLQDGKYVNYSFYSHEAPHATPFEVADYFMKHTNKQIKYTLGLKMRHPSTYEVPITQEEALKRWSKNGMFDVREYEDWIDFQEVTGNDMW